MILPGTPVRRYAFCLLLLVLAGCNDSEPLAPAFAGKWASRARGRSGGARVTINKSGISAPGMLVDGLTFTKATVAGATPMSSWSSARAYVSWRVRRISGKRAIAMIRARWKSWRR